MLVADNQKPVIIPAANVLIGSDQNACSATVALAQPITSDNCGVKTVSNDHPSTPFAVGTTVVTWIVTDIHDNTNTATQTVTVVDNIQPTITAPVSSLLHNLLMPINAVRQKPMYHWTYQ